MTVLRTYARVYASSLDVVVPALARVSGAAVDFEFSMPNGLELAAVGRVLVIAGPDDVLESFRSTRATVIVDDLDGCLRELAVVGARVVRGPDAVPTGRNLTAELPGGARVEYVEWDAAQWEKVGGRRERRPAGGRSTGADGAWAAERGSTS